MNNKKVIIILLFFLYITGSLLTIEVDAANPRCIWIIIDQISLTELMDIKTENIDYLHEIGAFGLVNVRQADGYHPGSTYLSIGAGNRSKGNPVTHYGRNSDQGVVNTRIKSLKIINKNNIYNSQPGLLGQKFREADQKIAVLGNCDSIEGKKRTTVALAMDNQGRVPLGDVGKSVLKESNKPWGYETNWDIMKEKYRFYNQKVDFLIIETGDFTRINDYYNMQYKFKEQNKEQIVLSGKREALRNIDGFIGFLIDQIDLSQTQLGIIVPTPSPEQIRKGDKLSWILLAGRGIDRGWLTSTSTTRQGIITISDLLPSLFDLFNISHSGLAGRPVEVVENRPDWQDIIKLNNKIYVTSKLRPLFVKGFIFFQLIIIIMAIIKIWYDPVILNKIYEYILLGILLIPFNFLILSIYYPPQLIIYLVILLVLTVIEIYLIKNMLNSALKTIILITAALTIIIVIDLFSGYRLMADSLLGYSSIIGARYYGLGNEYMGLFIGGAIITITGIFELLKGNSYYNSNFKKIFLGYLVILTFLIGYPGLGANFGGTITVITAGIFTFYYMDRKKFPLGILFILISTFIIILYLDYIGIFGKHSHIGRAVQTLLAGDFETIGEIISRKILINLRLLRWTIWTRVLLAFFICIIVVFRYPVGKLQKLFNDYPYLAAGYYGGIAGCFITFFVNDSGVVATATLLFFPVMTLLYIIEEYGYN